MPTVWRASQWINNSNHGHTRYLFSDSVSIVLIALAIDTFFNLSDEASRILFYVDNAICIIFIADFFYCLIRAKNKLEYLKWG